MQDTATESTVVNIPVAKTVKVSDVDGLADVIREYITWQKAATEADTNKTRLRKIIDEARGGTGGVITFNGVEVVFDKPIEGTRTDSKALLLKYPKVHADVQVPNSPRFTVVNI